MCLPKIKILFFLIFDKHELEEENRKTQPCITFYAFSLASTRQFGVYICIFYLFYKVSIVSHQIKLEFYSSMMTHVNSNQGAKKEYGEKYTHI